MTASSSIARMACVLILLGPVRTSAQTASAPDETGLDGARGQAMCDVHLSAPGFTEMAPDLARVIDLRDTATHNSFVLRRSGRGSTVSVCAAPPGVGELATRLATDPPHRILSILPARMLVVGNSAYPRDWNDGALWGGRGLNVALTTGAQLRWGPLSAALAPVLAWHSNGEHDIRTRTDTAGSPYRHPWWGDMLDAPSRFGDDDFTTLDAGASYIRLDAAGLAVGFSNEALVWGPARRNPLVLSGTAPGFTHLFIETARAIDVWIGRAEGQLFWGRLEESDHFDLNPDNDQRVLAGFLVALRPRFMDGLAIGGGRTQSFTWWPGLPLSEVLLRPYRGVRDNPQGQESGDNQLITLFFRWAAAPLGLEAYGEWAREDHWGSSEELLRNLDSSQAYTLGLQKLIDLDERGLRIAAEITHLADALPVRFASRGLIPFYSNTAVTQGHTHRGQMLGAPIGTGAEAQWMGADLFTERGRTGVSLERARYEDDAYYAYYSPRFAAHARDAEWTLRLSHARSFADVFVDAEVGWSTRYNRAFLGLDSIQPGESYRRETNLGLRLSVTWTPPIAARDVER